MSVIFSDPFTRADGPIGNDWVNILGSWTISTNRAKSPSSGPAPVVHGGANAYPDIMVEVDWLQGNGNNDSNRIYLRTNNTATDGYTCNFVISNTLSLTSITIARMVGGAETDLVRALNTPQGGQNRRLQFQASGNRLSAYVDGHLWISTTDDTFAGGDYFGFSCSATNKYFDNFSASEALTYNLFASPNTVDAGSANNQITLTTSAPGWEEGTPGSPIFTADIGTIISQEVDPLGVALIVYDAPGFVCTDTIRDPLNGTSVPIGIGQAVGGDVGEVLRRLGPWTSPRNIDTWATDLNQTLLPAPSIPTPTPFQSSFAQIDFSTPFAQLQITVADQLKQNDPALDGLWAPLAALLALCANNLNLETDTNVTVHSIETVAHYTLLDVIESIKGTSSISNTEILSKLNDIATPNDYTLGDILLAIAGVRGIDERNLTQIYDLIEGLSAPDLSPVLTILNHLTANDTQTIQTILNAIDALNDAPAYDDTAVLAAIAAVAAGLAAHELSLSNKVTDLIDNAAYGLHAIKDELEEVHSKLTDYYTDLLDHAHQILTAIGNIQPGTASAGAPVWPGLAKVTVGQGVPLQAGLTVAGPLDGVIITITGVPPYTGRYLFDGHSSYTHVGAVSFVNDDGAFEFPQAFGFERNILCPKTMKRAASAVVRTKQALEGFCYPWTINP